MLYFFKYEPFIDLNTNVECYDSLSYTFMKVNGEYHYWWSGRDDLSCDCCNEVKWKTHCEWKLIRE